LKNFCGKINDLILNNTNVIVFGFLFATAGFYPQDSLSQNSTNNFDPYTEPIPGSEESIDMVPVPGGSFTMGSGSGEADEGPQHKVKVNSFWMSKHEITWDQYDLFVKEKLGQLANQLPASADIQMTADAVSLPTPPYIDMSFGMGREGFPAINMTHYAAVMYSKWLTAKTGHFYRLPTEAEWESACRAGSESEYSFGDDSSDLDNFGWYKANSDNKYHKVGEKEPNALGLYDMHGNVAEWTTDQYIQDYFSKLEDGVAENPVFLPDELYPRSLRGGSWQDEAADLRCAARRGSKPKWKQHDPQLPKSLWWLTNAPFVGFRLVRPADQPTKEQMEKYWIKAIEDYN
jgi:formylglycine-generating enzyme required for sulfatase activity